MTTVSSRDALARRDASEKRFLEAESKSMELPLLWSKFAAPDIDALVTQFKSALARAEVLGEGKVVPWTQQGVESGTLDRKLHELREAVYTWRDYRPHGKKQMDALLSLRRTRSN